MAISEYAWDRLKRKRISLEIGQGPGYRQKQFHTPLGTLVTQDGLLHVADHDNNRVQVFKRDDGAGPIALHHIELPRSLSEDGSIALCYNRTAFDLSPTSVPIERQLKGKWQGFSWYATVLSDQSLLVLTIETLERFKRRSNGEWQHQQKARITLLQSKSRSTSFTYDRQTERLWWCWTQGPYSTRKHFIGAWDLTSGTQFFQTEIPVRVCRMSSHLDSSGCILAVGNDEIVYRMGQSGSIVDECNPGFGLICSISTAPDSTIVLTSLSKVMVY